jgi:hypothetical protein
MAGAWGQPIGAEHAQYLLVNTAIGPIAISPSDAGGGFRMAQGMIRLRSDVPTMPFAPCALPPPGLCGRDPSLLHMKVDQS